MKIQLANFAGTVWFYVAIVAKVLIYTFSFYGMWMVVVRGQELLKVLSH